MIEIKNLTFSYLKPDGTQKSEEPQLSRVNLEILPGEFVLVCGPTGSGKSTFLKTLNGLAPSFTGGVISGQLLINGVDYLGREPHDFANLIGYVNQQPEGAFVADTVLDEIVYSAEQLAIPKEEIANKVEWLSKLLNLEGLLDQALANLSGGQQQRVAIAAALISGAKILLLDEPTSALDLDGATEVLSILKKLAKEESVTVLLAEHRISRVLGSVDSVLVVHGDGSVTKGNPEDQFNDARFAPPIIELGQRLGWKPLAISNAEANKRWIEAPATFEELSANQPHDLVLKAEELVVSFGSVQALKSSSFELFGNQITALMGDNGSGKSSLCWALQGSGTRTSGEVSVLGQDPRDLSPQARLALLAMVPQRAADLLFLQSLADELHESDEFADVPAGTTASIFQQLAGRIDTSIHPRDLSAGQQLALVLALQLVKDAPVLILDEPTRGLDYAAKRALAKQLKNLRATNRSILLATHDIEFVAMVADRVLTLVDGTLVSDESPIVALGAGSSRASQIAEITATPGLITIEQVKR
jgi:energy-coupling factor transport system ATP-binding protein